MSSSHITRASRALRYYFPLILLNLAYLPLLIWLGLQLQTLGVAP